MENVILTVHLILAALLIGVVLLQRSEGGGLGLGGGGGGGGIMTGRQAANALSRGTWMLATGFLITSIALTVIAARGSATGSVVDRIAPASTAPATSTAPGLPDLGGYTPPPGTSSAPAPGQPVLPPVPGNAAPTNSTAPAQTAEPAPAAPVESAPAAATTAEPATAPAEAPAAQGDHTTTVTVPLGEPATPAAPATN